MECYIQQRHDIIDSRENGVILHDMKVSTDGKVVLQIFNLLKPPHNNLCLCVCVCGVCVCVCVCMGGRVQVGENLHGNRIRTGLDR